MKVPTENYTAAQLQAAVVEMRERVAQIVDLKAQGDRRNLVDAIRDIPVHADGLDVMLAQAIKSTLKHKQIPCDLIGFCNCSCGEVDFETDDEWAEHVVAALESARRKAGM